MHPYRNLLNVEQDVISPKLVSALRGIACVEVIFGCTIVGIELTANFLDQNADIFSSVLGIWAGFMTIMTGLAAYTNSRISGRIHPIHSTFLALGHTFGAAFAAVSTLGVFGLRCVNLRTVPVHNAGFFSNRLAGSASLHDRWNMALMLEYSLIVLYIINFMVLGVSFGMSGAVLRSVRRAKLVLSVPETDEMEVHTHTTLSAPILPGEEQKKKTQIITDLEATADGFYRRLQEDPDDSEDIARESI